MDPFTRRIICFGVHADHFDAVAFSRMFNKANSTKGVVKHLSADNDPLYLYHQWQTNLRILGADEIRTVPYTPLSHPFIERLIGTFRREFLYHRLFWNEAYLERILADFQAYYNQHHTHSSLGGVTPADLAGGNPKLQTTLNNFRWLTHCRGLYQLPAAA